MSLSTASKALKTLEEDSCWSSSVQVYLELMAGGKRDQEIAEQVKSFLLTNLRWFAQFLHTETQRLHQTRNRLQQASTFTELL